MKKFILVFAVLAVVLCVALAPARAELITITISGHITGIDDPSGHFGGQISVNALITGTYTFDTAISGLGSYQYSAPPAGISVAVGVLNFQTDPTNVDFSLDVTNNDLLGYDYYGMISRHNLPLPDSTPVQYISWGLGDSTGTALPSDVFPLTAPDLSKWNSNVLNIFHDRDYSIQATITSAVLVPEPATILLFGLGLMLTKRIH